MTRPELKVEIAFNAGYATPAADRVWIDVTSYVLQMPGVHVDHGRRDEYSVAEMNSLSLTLNNTDGQFTPGLASSPHYPNVKLGRVVRVTSTPAGQSASVRFLGYMGTWPVEWPGITETHAECGITAHSRLARLGRGIELRSIVEEEILLDDPIAYYPLGEAEGAVTVTDVSGHSAPSLREAGSGTAVVFGSATGPSTDGLTAAEFTGGKRLSGLYGSTLLSGVTTVLIEAFFASSTTAQQQRIMSLANSAGAHVPAAELISLGIDQTTGVLRGGFGVAGVNVVTSTSPNSVADGNVHHAAYRVTISGGSATGTLWLDGVLIDADTAASGAFPTTIDTTHVGGDPNGISGELHFTGSIAHAAAYVGTTEIADTSIEEHADSGLTGFEGESPGDRLRRYAAFAGAGGTGRGAFHTDFETGQVLDLAHIDTTGKTVLAAMREVETTEGGVLFDARDGALTFHDRAHRYGTVSAITLDVLAEEVAPAYVPVLDDVALRNDVTATGAAGVTARVTDADSVADHGAYRESLDVATTDPDEPFQAASWRVGNYADPAVRVPTLTVELSRLSPARQAAVLALTLGDKITVTNLMSQSDTTSKTFYVEGYAESVGSATHSVAFNVSPAAVSDVWILNDATYSVLDTTTRLAY